MYVYNVYVSVVYQCVCLVTCHSDMDPLARSGPVTGGPDTQVIQRPTHGTNLRSVPVRTVKTRRRFSFKIASFHMSICSYIFSYLLLPVGVHVTIRIISCDCLIFFFSMITCAISYDVSECSLYLYSWYERLSLSFHVLRITTFDPRLVVVYLRLRLELTLRLA